MDFSHNSQALNEHDEFANVVNPTLQEQDLLRRFTASRTGGATITHHESSNTFGFARFHPSSINTVSQGDMAGQTNPVLFRQGAGQTSFSTPAPSLAVGNTLGTSGSSHSAVGSAGGESPFPMGMHHNDREEEILLQLLLARRRRQELQQGLQQQDSDMCHPGLSDEFIRLRQQGNAVAASSNSLLSVDQGEQQLHQQFHQQAQPSIRVQPTGMFPQSPALSFPPTSQLMMTDPAASSSRPCNGPSTNHNSRSLDDYLLMTQQQQLPQESVFPNPCSDQQRIELSPSRFLSLQQQQQQQQQPTLGFLDMGGSQNQRSFGEDSKSSGGDLEKMENMEPAIKKKRLHKKKPSDMPRRPLSAYNLFFSEERERILREIDDKHGVGAKQPNDEETEGRKPQALLRPLLPSEKKRRPHRKTHGKISFRLLAQMVGQRWKALPEDQRKYYQELAKEDMARQKQAMEEYYARQSEKVKNLVQTRGRDGQEVSADTQQQKCPPPPAEDGDF